MNENRYLLPLALGQIRPRGPLAEGLRVRWATGPAEGSPEWARLGVLAGEGRGKLQVRGWAQRTGVTDLDGYVGLKTRPADTAWADELEAQARAGHAGLDEYVCQMVWADPAGLRVALYGPATVKTDVAGVPVELNVDAEYPDPKVVNLEVFPEAPVEFTLFFRIPGWAKGCMVTGQGASGVDVEDHDGWIELRRPWNRGDQLTLGFD